MPFYACPTCGSSISDAAGPPPAACPWCCASIRVEEDVPEAVRSRWKRRARPVLRMPLGSDALAPSAARHALGTLRPELGEERYCPAELLVAELETNFVRHTAAHRSIAASDMR